MIISASRRTDIPAFYGPWLAERLREGEALVRNPFNPRRITRVDLRPEAVDCLVLWTKNPEPLMSRMEALEPYPYYFQFTLNPYGSPLEPGLPEVSRRVDTFRELSGRLGRHRVIWRYDPILLSPRTPPSYHLEQFERLTEALAPWTCRCVISFLDEYAKIGRRLAPLEARPATPGEMAHIARAMAGIAAARGLAVESCCEPALPADYGVKPGRCVDPELIARLTGRPAAFPAHAGQRPGCGCVRSVDIGAYDTCGHGCLYCYANGSPVRVRQNRAAHDPRGPLLTGQADLKAASGPREDSGGRQLSLWDGRAEGETKGDGKL